ncbi:MAG: S-adenosylmethionine:tRNA ribosyltransferase-isomerase, partial [Woeseiaceae bacterium]|nr:S-adenosylmethionine:tRNA ribosyltransferase-isomerase [Woeseiaceae bacterium]
MALIPCAPMFISEYDYRLPDELIARYPCADRRGSRLLELGDGIHDRAFGDFPALLQPNDLLVFNDTRVIKARLAAKKATGGRAEILVERLQGERAVLAHIKASKSPKQGGRLLLADDVVATVIDRVGDLYSLNFSTDVLPVLEAH